MLDVVAWLVPPVTRRRLPESPGAHPYNGSVNLLTALGALTVESMLVFYALEVELVWSGVALRRWWRRTHGTPP